MRKMKVVLFFSSLVLTFFSSSVSFALTLPESINLALKNNPAVLVAQSKVDSANAKLAQATGAFLPTVKLDGNYGRSYSSPQTVQIGTQEISFANGESNSQGYSLSLSQPLFVAAMFPGYRLAVKNSELARADLDKSILETSFNARQSYFNVLKAQKMAEVAAEALAMAEAHRQKVASMTAAGAATRAESLRADVQAANSKVALTRANNLLELAKNAFNNALGLDLQEPVELFDNDFSGLVATLPTYDSLMTEALASHPDARQFMTAKAMSQENLNIAKAAYWPTVMLSAMTGNHLTVYPSYRSDVNSWSVTGAASWTLFDGMGLQNRVREAEANLAAQVKSEDQIKNGLRLAVRDAYLELQSVLETVDLTKTVVDSAAENFLVTDRRFNSGVGTNLEVLDAQTLLTRAKGDNAAAIFDVEIARAKLNKAVGKEVL